MDAALPDTEVLLYIWQLVSEGAPQTLATPFKYLQYNFFYCC